MLLGVYLPPRGVSRLRALVVHRVLQTVPVFVIGGVIARAGVPRAPVLVQVLESGQVPMKGCAVARVRTPITIVLSRPLQQPYTPPGSSVVAYVFRSFTKKSNDSLVGQRQCFVVGYHVYDERFPLPRIYARERVKVELERVRSGSLGGVPPQLAHQGEVDAGFDALHVGEDHGGDIQVGIEGGTDRIEHVFTVPELHGGGAGRRVMRRGFCLKLSIFFCVVL